MAVGGNRQVDGDCSEPARARESSWRSNFGSHCFQNVYAGVNRSLTADARRLFARAALPADYCLPPWRLLSPNFPAAGSLQTGNDEDNLAFRRLGLVMRKKFTGGAAPEFLEFFCEFSSNTKLPFRHDLDAFGERFG